MKIIKEFTRSGCKDDEVVLILRNDFYSESFESIQVLYHLLIQDTVDMMQFPTLKDIVIVHYGGNCYKGTFGLEVKVKGNPPNDYAEVASREYRL